MVVTGAAQKLLESRSVLARAGSEDVAEGLARPWRPRVWCKFGGFPSGVLTGRATGGIPSG